MNKEVAKWMRWIRKSMTELDGNFYSPIGTRSSHWLLVLLECLISLFGKDSWVYKCIKLSKKEGLGKEMLFQGTWWLRYRSFIWQGACCYRTLVDRVQGNCSLLVLVLDSLGVCGLWDRQHCLACPEKCLSACGDTLYLEFAKCSFSSLLFQKWSKDYKYQWILPKVRTRPLITDLMTK